MTRTYQTRYNDYLYRQLELAYCITTLRERLRILRARYDMLLVARLYHL